MDGGFYQRLGVDPGASTGHIRAAYGRAVAALVRRRKEVVGAGGDPSSLDWQRERLDEAWEVLSDPVRRRRYDAMLEWLEAPADGSDAEAFWERVGPSMVHPAAAAAVRLLRATTHLQELGAVKASPSAAEGEPPTLVPHDDDRTAPRAARLEGLGSEGAGVVPLPTAASAPPERSLRVVEGSPEANPVIVLPSQGARPRELTPDDVGRLVETHGFTGALLRAVREARGLDLQDVADTTRISARYLEAIEADDHAALPSATFVRGYVREMARVLQLDDAAVVEGYMQRLSGQP